MDEQTTRDRIKLLADLHRPLEEHWASSAGVILGLDAKGSDHLFKHHITRLREIYRNHQHEDSIPTVHRGLINTSPVTQLYGINGLKTSTPEWVGRERNRESRWNDDVQVSTNRDVKESQRKKKTQPIKSLLPSRESRSKNIQSPSGIDASISSQRSQERLRTSSVETVKKIRYQCHNEGISDEDVILLGMYRLNEKQRKIYDSFVGMLMEFDPHDIMKIMEDAINDVNVSGGLDSYGGFES